MEGVTHSATAGADSAGTAAAIASDDNAVASSTFVQAEAPAAIVAAAGAASGGAEQAQAVAGTAAVGPPSRQPASTTAASGPSGHTDNKVGTTVDAAAVAPSGPSAQTENNKTINFGDLSLFEPLPVLTGSAPPFQKAHNEQLKLGLQGDSQRFLAVFLCGGEVLRGCGCTPDYA